jgi:hypothetical protein
MTLPTAEGHGATRMRPGACERHQWSLAEASPKHQSHVGTLPPVPGVFMALWPSFTVVLPRIFSPFASTVRPVIREAFSMAKTVGLTPVGALSFGFVQPYFKRVSGCSLFFLFHFFKIFPLLDSLQE